ncbi:Predicted protein [Listeria monocytogenes]|nr:hypothetical protein AOB47_1726c [Listeria monocytogenes]CDK32973.1 Predicted protein [Listeria monocytogenes QOC2]CDK43095.1 Predicted protein [Listeria monocytogenes QOC1]CDM17064.1 Predicted protein [Listeria monocytogenes R479a]CDN70266.1 Predicted protein [Listeria monocytogenes 4423]
MEPREYYSRPLGQLVPSATGFFYVKKGAKNYGLYHGDFTSIT